MANSGTTPSLKPSRSLSTSNTARWDASSMRPAISAYTIAPTTLTASTQSSAKRYVAPAAGSVTSSPMSTNPPIAVTTPRATAASFRTPSAYPRTPRPKPVDVNRLRVEPVMIDLIPGHGWLDLAGVVIVVLVAFGVFFLGLAATVARVRD